MVKFIRLLSVLSLIVALTGCLHPEYHLYTRSISKSQDWGIREIPKELFNGTYQRLNYYSGSPEGLVTFNTNRCKSLGFDLVADLDTNATCPTSGDEEVIKMHKIVQVNSRLFVEAKVKTGAFQSRFALFELIPTKDKFVLIQMIYQTDKLMNSDLDFSKSESGFFRSEGTYFEVQNSGEDTRRLLETMKHTHTYNSIHFKATSEEQNKKIRELLKGRYHTVATQEFPFGNEESCEKTASNSKENFVGTFL